MFCLLFHCFCYCKYQYNSTANLSVITSGPEHPWLVAAYADSVPHPFGSVIGQEFFELGLIPSDTDFRIFRDFGKIPGMFI